MSDAQKLAVRQFSQQVTKNGVSLEVEFTNNDILIFIGVESEENMFHLQSISLLASDSTLLCSYQLSSRNPRQHTKQHILLHLAARVTQKEVAQYWKVARETLFSQYLSTPDEDMELWFSLLLIDIDNSYYQDLLTGAVKIAGK